MCAVAQPLCPRLPQDNRPPAAPLAAGAPHRPRQGRAPRIRHAAVGDRALLRLRRPKPFHQGFLADCRRNAGRVAARAQRLTPARVNPPHELSSTQDNSPDTGRKRYIRPYLSLVSGGGLEEGPTVTAGRGIACPMTAPVAPVPSGYRAN